MRNDEEPRTKDNLAGGTVRVVQVEFSHPEATAVAIAGTFNDWRPEVTPMVSMGGGRWRKELVLPPGVYEYLLVADGRWVPDPRAGRVVPNPFGGVNSVLIVPFAPNGHRKQRKAASPG